MVAARKSAESPPPSTAAAPRLRADAQRNRDRLLEVADEVFSEQGAAASLDDIARRAGVGIGTLYRHFPTRDALLLATLGDRLALIGKKGKALLGSESASEGLAAWMKLMIKHTSTYCGLAASLGGTLEGLTSACEVARAAGAELLERAQKAGEIRQEVPFSDVESMVMAIAFAAERAPGDKGRMRRLLALLFEGLRPRGAG
ncbi:TetR/AcrR family transcriptional regulator [Chondromyces crocatus]|uniref:TetR family transcriptional regulator n=1 Tax=Chondromyces crocatus TaxID=52 RepID=A0A0K1EBZ2_CHOCO|nr:TetR/AcrR family transcriptional regulator [Chondromyces crocatus]AKT38390.1 TetR family transcriptional regulator [Chondromyces crocatus]